MYQILLVRIYYGQDNDIRTRCACASELVANSYSRGYRLPFVGCRSLPFSSVATTLSCVTLV